MSTVDVSATQLLHQRHEEIKKLFADTVAANGDARVEIFDCLRATLAAHEAVEEMFVHSLARDMDDEAEAIVKRILEQEAEAAQALSDLEELGPNGDQFGPRLLQFQHTVEEHAAMEEDEWFPIVEANLGPKQLREIADSILLGEELAPTHAHPHASQNPDVLMLTGPFVAMIDHARDHLKRLTQHHKN